MPKFKTETKAAAAKLGIHLQLVEARTPQDIDRAFVAISKAKAEAVFIRCYGPRPLLPQAHVPIWLQRTSYVRFPKPDRPVRVDSDIERPVSATSRHGRSAVQSVDVVARRSKYGALGSRTLSEVFSHVGIAYANRATAVCGRTVTCLPFGAQCRCRVLRET